MARLLHPRGGMPPVRASPSDPRSTRLWPYAKWFCGWRALCGQLNYFCGEPLARSRTPKLSRRLKNANKQDQRLGRGVRSNSSRTRRSRQWLRVPCDSPLGVRPSFESQRAQLARVPLALLPSTLLFVCVPLASLLLGYASFRGFREPTTDATSESLVPSLNHDRSPPRRGCLPY
jgi:hypothetical protein